MSSSTQGGTANVIVHLTDLHAGGDGLSDDPLLELMQVVSAADGEHPVLTVLTGDVVNCAMRTYFKRDRPDVTDYEVARVVERENWFVLPGNHEYNWAGYAGAVEFEKRIGPRHGVRDAAGWRFIGSDFGLPYTDQAFIPPEEVCWIEQQLVDADHTPSVLCIHHPPELILNADLLAPLLHRYDVRLILAGHTHKNSLTIFHGVPVVVTGAAVLGWYSVLTIQDSAVCVLRKNALRPAAESSVAIYDAAGRIILPQDMLEEMPSPASGRSGMAGPAVVYRTGAAVHVPVSHRVDRILCCDAAGRCQDIHIREGDRFPESVTVSVEEMGGRGGGISFPFFDDEGRSCMLSARGHLVLPDGEMHLSQTVSCTPVTHRGILAAGTLTGTIVFCDMKAMTIIREFDPHTLLSVSGLVGDGRGVCAACMDETIRGLDWEGCLRWETQLSAKNYGYSVYGSVPVVAGDTILVTAFPDRVVGLSSMDGKKIWEREIGPCHTFTPLVPSREQGLTDGVVVGDRAGTVWSFDPLTGREQVFAQFPGREIVSGALCRGAIVLNCQNGSLLRWSSGRISTWEYAVPEFLSTHAPIPLSRHIILPCWNGSFLAFPVD